MTDFGLTDGAVSTMKGVIYTVEPNLTISDLSHNVEAFNIQEASYRLYQVMQYYQKEQSLYQLQILELGRLENLLLLKRIMVYYIVTPDNGTLTNIAAAYGIKKLEN